MTPWMVFADGLSSKYYLPVLWDAGQDINTHSVDTLYITIHTGGEPNHSGANATNESGTEKGNVGV